MLTKKLAARYMILGQNPLDKTPRTIPRWTNPPGQNPPGQTPPPGKTPPPSQNTPNTNHHGKTTQNKP